MRPGCIRWSICSAFLLLSLSAGGCRCQAPGLTQVEPERIVAAPARLSLMPTYVGETTWGELEATNEGGVRALVQVSVDMPFGVEPSQLELVRGESGLVRVSFTPQVAGRAIGTLWLGSLKVEVEGEGLEIPACATEGACTVSRFDFEGRQCVELPRGNGAACQTRCVSGTCNGGSCEGRFMDCGDTDACTIDSCSEATGCTHTPVTCPAPTSPCKVAHCDSISGCGVQDAIDGTLCGPDECSAMEAEVCIAGQCVRRARPQSGRCANRWMPTSIPKRYGSEMVWDEARQRLVLFGGSNGNEALGDTWEWDGTRWTQRIPAASPPARWGHAMAYDAIRRRVVLFGGGLTLSGRTQHFDDTWEWDGTTWLQRFPTTAPPARAFHALAFDAAHQRIILFGGSNGDRVVDWDAGTWAWDGVTWKNQPTANSPPAEHMHAMAYDGARQRIVLFGGSSGVGTWEWDGVHWAERFPAMAPSRRSSHSMAYDATRHRVVLVGGTTQQAGLETWEWDGTTWALRSSVGPGEFPRSSAAMAYDGARHRVVVFGGFAHNIRTMLSDTWEWNGTMWDERLPAVAPFGRYKHSVAYDGARQRVVLFGGQGNSDTWEWDGASWAQRFPATVPPSRSRASMTYDAGRHRVVLFGGLAYGRGTSLSDTWEWNGTDWDERHPTTFPPARSGHAMAYDAARRRVVLFGGDDDPNAFFADTWEWDGARWEQRVTATSPPIRSLAAMAYDAGRQRVVLFGGQGDYLNSQADTWEWDGSNWARRVPTPSPSIRFLSAMAYDSTRQRIVLLGGEALNDTWEWDGTAWGERMLASSPPPPRGNTMVYDAARQRMTLVMESGDIWLLLPP